MAIIQSIVALITRSLGSILSALFGWAVIALFGPAGPREKIWLSALVASAAAWPLPLLGVIWPRLATFVLGFIPVPPWVPAWGIRLVWIVLAIIVPFVLGLVMVAQYIACVAEELTQTASEDQSNGRSRSFCNVSAAVRKAERWTPPSGYSTPATRVTMALISSRILAGARREDKQKPCLCRQRVSEKLAAGYPAVSGGVETLGRPG